MAFKILALASIAALCDTTEGFAFYRNTQSHLRTQRASCFVNPSSLFAAAEVASKYYQLEEMEDKETCTTEVFLSEDGTVKVGKTDGPLFEEASGVWKQDLEGLFEMNVKRTYETGKEPSLDTDMGVFRFEVDRTFTGQLSDVGGLVAVNGAIVSIDEVFGDLEVGFFNMIDTTEARAENIDEGA